MSAEWPDEERRTGDTADVGRRRRRTDPLGRSQSSLEEWREALDAHVYESREWRARQDERLRSVESRADLLDGRAGNDGGLIGAIGDIRGEMRAFGARLDTFTTRLDTIAAGVGDLKTKMGAVDNQKPPSRLERILTVAGPILVVLITTIGGIVVAYFALRGQLAGLHPSAPPVTKP